MRKNTRKKYKTRKRTMRGGRLTEVNLRFLLKNCKSVKKNLRFLREYLDREHPQKSSEISKGDLKLYLVYMVSGIEKKRDIVKSIRKKDEEEIKRGRTNNRISKKIGQTFHTPPPRMLSLASSKGDIIHIGIPTPHIPEHSDHGSILRAKQVEQSKLAAMVAAENAKAVPVFISGATGTLVTYVNGVFDPTSDHGADGRVIYERRYTPEVCLEHFNGYWNIKPVSHKNTGMFYARVEGNGALLDCASHRWTLGDGNGGFINPPPAIILKSEDQYRRDEELEKRGRGWQRPASVFANPPRQAAAEADAARRAELARQEAVRRAAAEAEAARQAQLARQEAVRQAAAEAEAVRQAELARRQVKASENIPQLIYLDKGWYYGIGDNGKPFFINTDERREVNLPDEIADLYDSSGQRLPVAAAASPIRDIRSRLFDEQSRFVNDLRESLRDGTPLILEGNGNIAMNGISYNPDSPTKYLRYNGDGEPYIIRAVLECVRTFDEGYADYLTYAGKNRLGSADIVLFVDRQRILEDLLGRSPSKETVETCLRDVTDGPVDQVPAAAAEEPKSQRRRWVMGENVELFVDKKRKSKKKLPVFPLDSELDISSAKSVNPASSSSGEDDLDSLGSRLSSVGSQGSMNRNRLNELGDAADDIVNFESPNLVAGPDLASPIGLDSDDPARVAANNADSIVTNVILNDPNLPIFKRQPEQRDADDGLGLGISSNQASPVADPLSPTGDLAHSLGSLKIHPPSNSDREPDRHRSRHHRSPSPPPPLVRPIENVDQEYSVSIQYKPEHSGNPQIKPAMLRITNQGVTITIDGRLVTLDVTVLRDMLYFSLARSIDMKETCRDSITPARENRARNFASSKCVRIVTKIEQKLHPISLAPTSITIPFIINFDNITKCDEFLGHLHTIIGRNQGGGKRRNNTRKQSHKKTNKYIQHRRKYKTKKSKRSTKSKRSNSHYK